MRVTKFILLGVFIGIVLVCCAAVLHSTGNKAINELREAESDEWTLVGNKDGCKLYYKYSIVHGEVYWSVCNNGNTSSLIIRQ